jgi:hypothetical protein
MNRIALTAAAALVACGGTQQNTTSIESSIPGITFDKPISAASSAAIKTCGQSSSAEVVIVLSDAANACSVLRSAANPASSTTVTIRAGTRGAQVVQGYSIGCFDAFCQLQGDQATVSITTVDAQGVSSTSEATGGSIFLNSVAGDTISGDFNATGFNLSPDSTAEDTGANALAGTFTATACHVPATDCSGS